MAMGTRRKCQRQEELWYRRDLAEAPGHPFYRRLNEVPDQAGFDEFCEARCHKFYHEKLGRPSLAPGMYFRVMLIGFFEGIESERGIAWRVAATARVRWCPGPESNRYVSFETRDFKSRASASFATRAGREVVEANISVR